MTTIPLDLTNANGVFDWIFHNLDVNFLGSVGMMIVLMLLLVFALLMFFSANKFTMIGFMTSLLMAFGMFGYSIVGWIAPVGAMIAGLLIGIAFITIFRV